MKITSPPSAYLHFLVRLMNAEDECDDVCRRRTYSMPDIVLIFEKKCWLIIFFTLIMIWWEVGQSKYDHRKQFYYECFCWTCAPFASVCARHLGFLSLFCLSQYELIWMVFFAKIEIYETQPTKSKKLFWQKS